MHRGVDDIEKEICFKHECSNYQNLDVCLRKGGYIFFKHKTDEYCRVTLFFSVEQIIVIVFSQRIAKRQLDIQQVTNPKRCFIIQPRSERQRQIECCCVLSFSKEQLERQCT